MWVFAQSPTKPFQSQSSSSISYSGGKEGDQAVEITNFAYELTGDSVSGRPRDSRLVLRTSAHSKQIVGDKGLEATVTLEAWPLGVDLKQKPLYAVNIPGIGARTLDGDLWLVDRSLDGDVSWWSVYKLASGQHLFDTYVDLLRFTVSRADGTPRYVGLEVPPDDTTDARLKDPHVIGVLTYASSAKVIREAILTCAETARAKLLRSYWDIQRTVTLIDRPAGRSVRIALEEAYPSPSRTTIISISISKDDLDLVHAEVPPGLRVVAWNR